MLTKVKDSQNKKCFWLELDGRPLAKIWREDDIDYILGLQDKD